MSRVWPRVHFEALTMTDLRLDWCSHDAARHGVGRWHYSRKMPASKLVRIGVWEAGRFVGVVLYGVGANRHLARPFGLETTEVCELVRVALAPGRHHPTSKVVAISLRMLHRQSPGLRIVVSYADRKEGHFGTIYQASNWLFLGASHQSYLRVKGAIVHPRSLYERHGPGGQSVAWLKRHVDPHAERVPMPAKLKYVYVFDRALRRQLAAQAQPYPKRVGSSDGAALGDQPREGGSTPTPTLHSSHQESTDGRSQQQADA